ncbi:MAG: tetratricopeptide repeat protein [Candidatus Omnitrophica bacterium]|nr:tetratricopeptide repeat protein [Candidatus Omnitrophota bacterium]MCM8803124.1 tetratricopeptide repeat protein [Candidatus Omnitrophota bacterium]
MKWLICFLITLFFYFSELNCEENIIEKVRKEFKEKNYKNVVNILEKEKVKKYPELNYYLGISYYNLKDFENAKINLENFIYKTTFSEEPYVTYETLRILFEIYWKNKKTEDIIKIGNYVLEKVKDKPKFSYVIQNIKNNLIRVYNERGNSSFWSKNYKQAIENYNLSIKLNPDNYDIKERLAESYYNIGEYEKSKEYFLEVIKNEKNNWYILFLSISFYREISNKDEKISTLNFLPEDSLSYKIFKSFENFENGMVKDGFEILKEEEEKRKTNGDISFNIINKIFLYDLKSSQIYLEFIKTYPNSSRNNVIINSLFNTITDENERKTLESYFLSLFDELLKYAKDKKTVVELIKTFIERRFDRRLLLIDDYLEKINMFEIFLSKIDEDKYKEDIIRRIAENYRRIEEYGKAREYYTMLIKLTGKEDYNFHIAESYFLEGNIEQAEKIVDSFLSKYKDNENAKLLLAKIYLEKGEIEKSAKVLKEMETNIKNKSLLREIESLKNNFFEMKDKSENLLYVIFRNIDSNSSRLIPEDRITFLNQITKEIEFYANSDIEKETKFHLKCKIDGFDFSSSPYVMIESNKEGLYFNWEGNVSINKNELKKKNLYKVFYPVKEINCEDFDLKYKNEIIENKFVLSFDFSFKDIDWEISIKNVKNYEIPLKIEPKPVREEGNLIFWDVKGENFKITIEYPENKNIIFYFPEIEIKRKIVEERKIVGGKKSFDIENFELVIDDFEYENVKIVEENVKIYNIKGMIFRK